MAQECGEGELYKEVTYMQNERLQPISDRKVHYDNLDLIKTLAIMAVLTLHVPLWRFDFIAAPSFGQMMQYAMRLISEGVPAFMAVNGFLLLGKKNLDLRKHLKKTGKIFILFLIWSVILISAGSALAPEAEHLTIRSVVAYILGTNVGSRYTGVLWFLQNLIAIYLVFPILWKVYQDDWLFKYLFIAVAVFTVGIDTIELLRDYRAVRLDPVFLNGLLSFIRRFSFAGNEWYLFYFMLGGMIFRYYECIHKKKWNWAVAGLICWGLAFCYGYVMSCLTGNVFNPAFNYGSVFMMLFLIGLMAFTKDYQNNGGLLQRMVASIGANTFGIYLSHYLFIYLIRHFWNPTHFIQRFAAYLFVFMSSWAFSVGVRRIPGLKRLTEL